MKSASLLSLYICLFAGFGCSKPEVEIEGTYQVSIFWRAGSAEGVIFNETYHVLGNRQLASDEKNEFQLSDYSEQLIPATYTLNKEFETEVNGVGITVGDVSATADEGVTFPLERMLTFYKSPNQPRIEIYLKIREE